MIPHLTEHIGRYARVLDDIDNRHPVYESRPGFRLRQISADEIVRVLDIKKGRAHAVSPSTGDGWLQVNVKPVIGGSERAFYTYAHHLELLPEGVTVGEALDPRPRTADRLRFPTPSNDRPDVYAQRLAEAHKIVFEAYTVLAYALNDLQAIEKEANR